MAMEMWSITLVFSQACEVDRFFGAGEHAQPAGMALVGVYRESLLAAMDRDFEADEKGQGGTFVSGQLAHFEHVIGANAHAIFLALAFVVVDHGPDDTGGLLAGGCVFRGHQRGFRHIGQILGPFGTCISPVSSKPKLW